MIRPRLRPTSIRAALGPSGLLSGSEMTTLSQMAPSTGSYDMLPSYRTRQQRRTLISVPRLGKMEAQGVRGFLSPAAVNLAWTQYQRMLIDKINTKVAQTPDENMDTKDLSLAVARDPTRADLFNCASMAHNNHFFFRGLKPDQPMVDKSKPELGVVPTIMPHAVRAAAEESFGSLETFKQTMLHTANAMFGPGFVWLVRNNSNNRLSLLNTYLAGSPYKEAHNRRQGVDMNTVRPDDEYAASLFETTKNMRKGTALGGADISPLLCVCTWEHVWIPDYGVYTIEYGSAKEHYLNAWWNVINWDVINDEVSGKRVYVTS